MVTFVCQLAEEEDEEEEEKSMEIETDQDQDQYTSEPESQRFVAHVPVPSQKDVSFLSRNTMGKSRAF